MSVASANAMALPGCRSANPVFQVTRGSALDGEDPGVVVLVPRMDKLATGLYVDIKQRQRVVRRNRPPKVARFAKDEPCSGSVARKPWDICRRHVQDGRGVMSVLCGEVDEHLQRVGSCAGTGRFVVKGTARGFEPIKITGCQIEVIAKRIAVVKRAFAVLEHDRHGRQPGMGMCPEGGLRHGEVIHHDKRVHQPPEVCMLVALRLKTVANRERATAALGMGFAGDACELVDLLRVHVILSLCVVLTITARQLIKNWSILELIVLPMGQ